MINEAIISDIMSREDCGLAMSNFDMEQDEGLVDALEDETYSAHHYAWNFCAVIGRRENKYASVVQVYGSVAATIEADTLEELMQLTNEEYGHD